MNESWIKQIEEKGRNLLQIAKMDASSAESLASLAFAFGVACTELLDTRLPINSGKEKLQKLSDSCAELIHGIVANMPQYVSPSGRYGISPATGKQIIRYNIDTTNVVHVQHEDGTIYQGNPEDTLPEYLCTKHGLNSRAIH